eukprot:1029371-Rhodomonas_salina.1
MCGACVCVCALCVRVCVCVWSLCVCVWSGAVRRGTVGGWPENRLPAGPPPRPSAPLRKTTRGEDEASRPTTASKYPAGEDDEKGMSGDGEQLALGLRVPMYLVALGLR